MQEQRWNDYPRCNLKKEKHFWIGSSENHGSIRNSTNLSPIKEKIRDVPLHKCSPGNVKRPTDFFKREKTVEIAGTSWSDTEDQVNMTTSPLAPVLLQIRHMIPRSFYKSSEWWTDAFRAMSSPNTTVEGATCNLQEKSKNQERVPSASQFSSRQKIDVTVGKNELGEFCPSYSGDVQHMAGGKPIAPVHNNKVAAQASSLANLESLTPVQRFGSTTLHLYLPTASYEEDEPNTTRDKNGANKDLRNPRNLKVDPLKPLVQKSSRRKIDKRTLVPCKEALSTANLSVQFCGDEKGQYSTPLRRSLIDNKINSFLLGDNIRNSFQRPVSNIGYRLGSYNSDKTANSSEYGLNVSTLKLSDDKPKGSYLLSQRRGQDKIDSFLRNKKDHEMNEEQSSRCRSQSDILDFETRNTYI